MRRHLPCPAGVGSDRVRFGIPLRWTASTRMALLIAVALAFRGGVQTAAFAGDNYAFLVAVAEYDEKELRPLKYTRPDVLDFHEQLLKSGFKSSNIILMHDDLEKLVAYYRARGKEYKPADYLPERHKILAELKLLLGTLREDDSIIVALAGHGVQFAKEKKTYFCPKDAQLGDRETLISFESIYETLSDSRAGKRMLLVDACQNDPQTEVSRSRSTVDLDSVTRPQTEPVPQGVVALFSCRAGQKSFEHPPLGHGVFFYHILEGWKGKADANGDGRLSYNELADYAESETARYARLNLKAVQTPTLRTDFSGEWFLREFGVAKPITNTLGMKLALIQPGEFTMGNTKANPNEDNPGHRVKLTRPYYLGVHEVTLGNFRAYVNATRANLPNGVGYDPGRGGFVAAAPFNWAMTGFPQTENHPVVNVSWEDADNFCKWLSRKEGKRYRLPTEAEWEYACRAGTETKFWCGDDEADLQGHANVSDASFRVKLPSADWTKPWNDGFPFTAPVGSFKANPFGLFDMHGNVQEWCGDWYGEKYYASSPPADPTGPTTGTTRVKRGGDFLDYALICGSAFRRSEVPPTSRGHFIGFRVARDAE